MIGEFIGEILGEMIIIRSFNALVAGVWWIVRNSVLLALYPVMLLTGWLRLWLREQGRTGFLTLWQIHCRVGLHRFGRQEAALDAESLLAAFLIVLTGGGICVMLYSLGKLWLL